jgi:sulfatase maturation enzyme AslB (radical SAM superfamily)
VTMMYKFTNIETSSYCNRRCRNCIRNTHPNRQSLAPWFEQNFMPMEMFKDFFEARNRLRPRGRITLCGYNEPLLDPRIEEIVSIIGMYPGFELSITTNGDYITEPLARFLDGKIKTFRVSLYCHGRERDERDAWIRSLFTKTNVYMKGYHVQAHYAPDNASLPSVPCSLNRILINHKGQYCLCCEDIGGEFDLGSFPDVGPKDFWYGAKRQAIVNDILAGKTDKYPYCMSCPKNPANVVVNDTSTVVCNL